jgi:hypothetical protein
MQIGGGTIRQYSTMPWCNMTDAELDAQLDMFTRDSCYQRAIDIGETARWEVNPQCGPAWADYNCRRAYRERTVLDRFDSRGELDRGMTREAARENAIYSMVGVRHFTSDMEEVRRPGPFVGGGTLTFTLTTIGGSRVSVA